MNDRPSRHLYSYIFLAWLERMVLILICQTLGAEGFPRTN